MIYDDDNSLQYIHVLFFTERDMEAFRFEAHFLTNVDVRQLRPGEGEYARHRITQQVKTDDYSSAPS